MGEPAPVDRAEQHAVDRAGDRVGDRAVVVGVDGSLSGARALDVAIREAQLRNRTLRLVHAFQWPVYTAVTAVEAFEAARPNAREAARQMLAEQRRYVEDAAPELRVEERFVEAGAAASLIAESADADLTVVGKRGLGGFAGLLLGSVSTQVSAHAASPVMVVPSTGMPRSGPVVVGVDGSAAAQVALRFAVAEAARHRAPLTVLYAYTSSRPAHHPAETPTTGHDSLDEWRKTYPEVTVTVQLEEGRGSAVLLSYASNARMVVVGSRGRGGFRGLLLGSTSQALLHHAPCPVVVVPHRVTA